MKSLQLLLITFLCAGLLVGCSKKEGPAELGDAAASLDGLTYVKGQPVTFEAGKIYVVEFWATWCPPCKTSIPHLTELQKQYKDKGVTIIGISNESIATVKSFTDKMGEEMEYTIAVDSGRNVGKGYMEAYGQNGIPTAFIVDGQGRVVWVGHPMVGLDEELAKITAEKSADASMEEAPPVRIDSTPKETTLTGKIGQKAGALEGLTYVKGEPVTFKDGKVYVVEFWATWCGPCRTSIPHLTEVQQHFKDKGVTVIGISSEKAETVKPFLEKQGDNMNYTVALDTDRKVNTAYMKAFNQGGIPTAFIVDGQGNVAWVGHPMDGLDEVLEQVIAGTFEPESYAKAKAEREAAQRELHKLFQEYNGALLQGATIEEIRPIAEKIIESKNPMVMNALAWQILTMPGIEDARRDTEMALKAAAAANTETNGESPMILDTYALALFQNDRVDDAIATQQKAIELAAGNDSLQAKLKEHLEQFRESLETEMEI